MPRNSHRQFTAGESAKELRYLIGTIFVTVVVVLLSTDAGSSRSVPTVPHEDDPTDIPVATHDPDCPGCHASTEKQHKSPSPSKGDGEADETEPGEGNQESPDEPVATLPTRASNTAAPYDKSIYEIVKEDDNVDGVVRVNSSAELQREHVPSKFISKVNWRGKCWYSVTNFCVIKGQLTMFHDPSVSPNPIKRTLRMCNEFTTKSPRARLKYISLPAPDTTMPNSSSVGPHNLPAPLLTKTQGWILQFWCQDLFHMTLSLMPAFHTRMHLGAHPDVYIRILKGFRKDGAYCHIKFGDPRSWEDVYNQNWGPKDQWPFHGNPYWPFYQVITPDPDRIHPLHPTKTTNGQMHLTNKSVCYTNGAIDKRYIKDMTGDLARNYSSAVLDALKIIRGRPRKCGAYRLTMIDRRGRTRRLSNVPEIVTIAREMGFIAESKALETISIREQLSLITSTDVLIGMHGNGITWLQFLPPGSVVVELIGVWYRPYSLLWGHEHLHSSMKNNMDFKRGGEFKDFAHNLTEVRELLQQAKEHLDKTSCGEKPFVPPNQRLGDIK